MLSRPLWILACLFLVAVCVSADTGQEWRRKTYAHYSDNEPVADVLQQFGAAIDSAVVISDRVEGTISGNFTSTTALAFLQKISAISGLIWYHDGQVLHVYDSGEVETALIKSSRHSATILVETLVNLNLWDARFTLNTSEVGLVRVSGPPRYIALVQEVASMLAASEQDVGFDSYVLQIFELQYAWADDREFVFKGKPVRVSGVASTLRDLLAVGVSANTEMMNPAGQTAELQREPEQASQNNLYQNSRSQNSRSQNMRSGGPQPLLGTGLVGQQNNLQTGLSENRQSYIAANERLNAVIVYDRKSRIPLYEDFIRALDKPMDQVQIEVSIIDINTEKLHEAGVEWQFFGPDGEATLGKLPGGSPSDFGSEVILAGKNGADIATLVPGSETYFLTKVRLLAQQGDARILSQPTVLTLNNIEAVLDNSTTFFVRLQGEDAVDLFPVSVGSVMRVTPHIVDNGEVKQIHMDINIEDGQRSGDQVDNIPAVSNSLINTQALVNENGSLLIGGYFFDSEANRVRKVPLLGDIPLMGRLFRSTTKDQRQLARLFLITPSIIRHSTLQELGSQADQFLNRQRGIFKNLEIN